MFFDRGDAGRELGERLRDMRAEHPVVLALPRGGVPVGAEVAKALEAPLDVLVVRKLGCPWEPELGIGAVAEGGVRIINQALVAALGLTPDSIEAVAQVEQAEVERRVRFYRRGRPAVPVWGKQVIVVDDGIATGFTARSAVDLLRRRGARGVTVATPVAPPETVQELQAQADRLVVLETPDPFWAIGQWYLDFNQTSDAEVVALLDAAAAEQLRSGRVDPAVDLAHHESRPAD